MVGMIMMKLFLSGFIFMWILVNEINDDWSSIRKVIFLLYLIIIGFIGAIVIKKLFWLK